MFGTSPSLTPRSIWPSKEDPCAARRSMPQVVDITSAAGTPLPVASPTTDLAYPQGGGGSRRSLLLPLWLAGSKELSASPPVGAPPWGARLAGYFVPP